MKILIIPSWYPNSFNTLGGIFFKEQAEALARYGHDVSVLSINQYSVREILKHKKIIYKNHRFTQKNVDTYMLEYPSIPKLHFFKQKINLYFFKKKFIEYVKRSGLPDIVHAHSFMAGCFALWIKETYNIPYIVTEHFSGFAREIISKSQLQMAQEVFAHSQANIAVSNEFKELLEDKFDGEFQYIPNIVNTHFFTPVQKHSDKRFKFINIAFLDKNKNQSMLVKAFAKVFKSNDKVTLTIVGDGPEYDTLKQLIEKLQMQKQIFLYGKANRDEVKKLLQQSDAFVLSSLYETFGVVVIEAMACGLPVVATKCGGPESIVQNDKLGLLAEKDTESLAQSMQYLYQNKDKYDSKYIVQYAKNNFGEETVCQQLTNLYRVKSKEKNSQNGEKKTILFIYPKKLQDGQPAKQRIDSFRTFYEENGLSVYVKEAPDSIVEKIEMIRFLYKHKIQNIFISMPSFRNWFVFLLPGIKVVFDIRDGWSIAIKSGYGGTVKPCKVKAYIASLFEKFAISRAVLTITCTDGLQRYLEKLTSRKVLLITNGCSKKDFKIVQKVKEEEKKRDILVETAICAGQFAEYGHDKVKTILLKINKKNKKTIIKLIGSNLEKNKWIINWMQEENLSNIELQILPRMSREEIYKEIVKVDYAIAVVRDPNYDFGTKVFDYILCGKAIFDYFEEQNNFVSFFQKQMTSSKEQDFTFTFIREDLIETKKKLLLESLH